MLPRARRIVDEWIDAVEDVRGDRDASRRTVAVRFHRPSGHPLAAHAEVPFAHLEAEPCCGPPTTDGAAVRVVAEGSCRCVAEGA